MRRQMQRLDRLIKDSRHDVYRVKGKLKNGTQCERCGACYINGRWTWEDSKEVKRKIVCAACRRIEDGYPAGYIEIKGEFYRLRREEIMNMIRNVEQQHKAGHPMERILRVVEGSNNCAMVETTGVRLARRIGETLQRAYQGDYDFQYNKNDDRIRVYWQRDA